MAGLVATALANANAIRPDISGSMSATTNSLNIASSTILRVSDALERSEQRKASLLARQQKLMYAHEEALMRNDTNRYGIATRSATQRDNAQLRAETSTNNSKRSVFAQMYNATARSKAGKSNTIDGKLALEKQKHKYKLEEIDARAKARAKTSTTRTSSTRTRSSSKLMDRLRAIRM